jgi:LuxR family maltose regulon positive regulatory protein
MSARIEQALGNHREASWAIDQGFQVAQGNDIERLSVLVSAYRTRVWLAEGRIELAAQWAEKYRQHGGTEYLREFEDLTLARVRLACGEPGAALSVLNPLLLSAEGAGRMGSAIEALALRALALCASEEVDEALGALERALWLARGGGYTRVFIDEGPPMARLLCKAARRGVAVEQISRLLTAFGAELEQEKGTLCSEQKRYLSTPAADETWIEPLTKRQMEVLELLAKGMTNPEIAERLFISLPTVKSHTRSIYGKLGVHNRKEAVARARTSGILPV